MTETKKVRISCGDGPAEMVDLLTGLVEFFGGELVDVSPPGEIEYEVRKNANEGLRGKAMSTHQCSIKWRDGKWVGVVDKYDWRDSCTAGALGERLFSGPVRELQPEAAQDAREWCKQNGIKGYLGPITSGMTVGCKE